MIPLKLWPPYSYRRKSHDDFFFLLLFALFAWERTLAVIRNMNTSIKNYDRDATFPFSCTRNLLPKNKNLLVPFVLIEILRQRVLVAIKLYGPFGSSGYLSGCFLKKKMLWSCFASHPAMIVIYCPTYINSNYGTTCRKINDGCS